MCQFIYTTTRWSFYCSQVRARRQFRNQLHTMSTHEPLTFRVWLFGVCRYMRIRFILAEHITSAGCHEWGRPSWSCVARRLLRYSSTSRDALSICGRHTCSSYGHVIRGHPDNSRFDIVKSPSCKPISHCDLPIIVVKGHGRSYCPTNLSYFTSGFRIQEFFI